MWESPLLWEAKGQGQGRGTGLGRSEREGRVLKGKSYRVLEDLLGRVLPQCLPGTVPGWNP